MRAAAISLVLFVIVVLAALFTQARVIWGTEESDPIAQPVQFDHRHHVKDDGIDCRYCHHAAETTPQAGMPSTALCMGCHAQIFRHSPTLAPVRESFFSKEPIPWVRVTRMPDFVYFHHGVHVQGGVGCVTCHGRVDQMARTYAPKRITMGWCLDCHRDPISSLRPPHEATNMTWAVPPGRQAALGATLVEVLDLNPPLYCTGCHR